MKIGHSLKALIALVILAVTAVSVTLLYGLTDKTRVNMIDIKGSIWFDHFRLYEGDYIEEEFEGKQEKAVEPSIRLTTTWAKIKTRD